MYVIRLDDASEYMDLEKWKRMEYLLIKYEIHPIVGIIPHNKDKELITKYTKNPDFWKLVYSWIDTGWIPAMHGFEHRYITENGGLNPVHNRSEFAGLPLAEQEMKLEMGYKALLDHGIKADIFFAPSHTYDANTLIALKNKTDIYIISDTIATNVYYKANFYFLPQQCGRARKIPFKFVTFCYHPNTMQEKDFLHLEQFIVQNRLRFQGNYKKYLKQRNYSIIDQLFSKLYFSKRGFRKG